MILEKIKLNKKKETAQLIVEFTEKTLKGDPHYESLSDDGKAFCLLFGSCLVLSKTLDLVTKGIKEFYERYR